MCELSDPCPAHHNNNPTIITTTRTTTITITMKKHLQLPICVWTIGAVSTHHSTTKTIITTFSASNLNHQSLVQLIIDSPLHFHFPSPMAELQRLDVRILLTDNFCVFICTSLLSKIVIYSHSQVADLSFLHSTVFIWEPVSKSVFILLWAETEMCDPVHLFLVIFKCCLT